MPIISTMPKDNHSLLQLYLDGQKIIFIHFSVLREIILKLDNKFLFKKYKYLKNKSIYQILNAQKKQPKMFLQKKNSL